MSIVSTREQRLQMARDNAKLPLNFVLIPKDRWPDFTTDMKEFPTAVWQSRNFLVQEYSALAPAIVRLSISRNIFEGDRWVDGITWNELQHIKNGVGYNNYTAVDIYHVVRNLVDVASIIVCLAK